jgi:hypothetical protein
VNSLHLVGVDRVGPAGHAQAAGQTRKLSGGRLRELTAKAKQIAAASSNAPMAPKAWNSRESQRLWLQPVRKGVESASLSRKQNVTIWKLKDLADLDFACGSEDAFLEKSLVRLTIPAHGWFAMSSNRRFAWSALLTYSI